MQVVEFALLLSALDFEISDPLRQAWRVADQADIRAIEEERDK